MGNAGMAEIRHAYRQAALTTHPDKEGGSAEAFNLVATAFDVLSCSVSRIAYDRTRRCYQRALSTSDSSSRGYNLKAAKVCGVSPGMGLHFNRIASKRKSVGATISDRKRLRGMAGNESHNDVNAELALDNLRDVLQSMEKDERKVSLAKLPARVHALRGRFMENRAKGTSTLRPKCVPPVRVHHASKSRKTKQSRQLKLQFAGDSRGRWYCAQADIGLLRIYTRKEEDVEKAVEHQLILSQVRDALHAAARATPHVWDETHKVEQLVADILKSNGSSRDKLELHTCVQMRATEYLHRKHVLTSPVMPLAKSLELRARLISARRSCWAEFSDLWAKSKCMTRNARCQQLTLKSARAKLSEARQEFLDDRFKLATLRIEEALLNEERKRRTPTTAALAVSREGSLGEHRLWKERIKIWLQRDLSEEEASRFCMV